MLVLACLRRVVSQLMITEVDEALTSRSTTKTLLVHGCHVSGRRRWKPSRPCSSVMRHLDAYSGAPYTPAYVAFSRYRTKITCLQYCTVPYRSVLYGGTSYAVDQSST